MMTSISKEMLSRTCSRSFLLGILLFLVSCGSAPTKEDKPIAKPMAQQSLDSLTEAENLRYHKALNLMKQGKYPQAKKLLAELKMRAPGLLELWLNLGIVQYKQKDFTQAEQSVAQAIAINKNSAPAHNLVGLIAIEQGEFKAAEQAFKRALAIFSEYALANFNLALLYDVYLHDVPSAVVYYDKYLASETSDETTQAWLEHLKGSMSK